MNTRQSGTLRLGGWQRLWVFLGVLYGLLVCFLAWAGSASALAALVWWILPMLSLYALGWSVAWVIRGFRQFSDGSVETVTVGRPDAAKDRRGLRLLKGFLFWGALLLFLALVFAYLVDTWLGRVAALAGAALLFLSYQYLSTPGAVQEMLQEFRKTDRGILLENLEGLLSFVVLTVMGIAFLWGLAHRYEFMLVASPLVPSEVKSFVSRVAATPWPEWATWPALPAWLNWVLTWWWVPLLVFVVLTKARTKEGVREIGSMWLAMLAAIPFLLLCLIVVGAFAWIIINFVVSGL